MRYQIRFYRVASGKQPAKDFLDGLSKKKRAILVAALKEILGEQGIDVCRTEWGKNLGQGLYEFRVRDRGVVLRCSSTLTATSASCCSRDTTKDGLAAVRDRPRPFDEPGNT